MERRWVRLILVLGFVVAATGASYALWTLDGRQADSRTEMSAFDDQADRAGRAVADLRAAVEAYVAAGQPVAFWAPRAADAIERYRAASAAIERLAPGRSASLVLAEDLLQLDTRARELVENGQTLVASDLVFTDGLKMLRDAAARVEEIQWARRAALAESAAAIRRQQFYTAVGALGAAVLVILLLLPAGREGVRTSHAGDAVPAPAPALAAHERDTTFDAPFDLALSEDPAPPEPRQWPAVDLEAVAGLCADLGRLADADELSVLLERAAILVGASGLTLWIADRSGEQLHPVAAHGYAPDALSRMGTLRRGDENATAAAYRTAALQTVQGGGDDAGALAVPLMTATGCVGVMAAEMAPGRERDDAVRAVARIVAAQLATLVPAPPLSEKNADAVARAGSG